VEVYILRINCINLSPYAAGLPDLVKRRYFQKINLIGDVDPYSKDNKIKFSRDLSKLCNVTLMEIYNYFVTRVSFYTKDEMKAYKSLDAYNYFLSGFVHSIKYAHMNENILIIGKVSFLYY